MILARSGDRMVRNDDKDLIVSTPRRKSPAGIAGEGIATRVAVSLTAGKRHPRSGT
jgi:hypothetical protein